MKVIQLALVVAGMSTMSASILTYVEAAGVQTSHLGGTVIEDFNSVTPGLLASYTSPIGTYSSGGAIMAPDIFGGANLSNYVAVGQESGALSYLLTFNGPQTFFGFYWLAMDQANVLTFYNGATVLATYTGNDFISTLSSDYFGNPNSSTDPTEKFAYVYFLSDNALTNFTSIQFSNVNPGTGFESDNHTILAGGPTAAPEPSTLLTMVPALVGMLAVARRRFRRG